MRSVPYGTKFASKGRVLVYAAAFAGAVALDAVTPLGVADWLIEVLLVWVASTFGSRRETRIIAAVGTLTMVLGLWTSPTADVPFWMAALNRLVAITVMWTMVVSAERRRAAEEAAEHAAAEIKVLRGLLPICAECKAIRNTEGEWQRLESYLSTHSEAQLSHGLCPECAAKYMAELNRGGAV